VFTTLVDAPTVRDHPEWVVVDCRHTLADMSLGRRLYAEAHLPGAFFADVESDLSGPKSGSNGRHPLPDPEAFASYLRSLGVDDDTQIVAYDAGADMFAARLWFLCRWIGHEATAVLDGGIEAWRAADLPLTSEASVARRLGNLSVRLNPGIVVNAAYVASHLDDPAVRIIDARANDRFHGRNETIDPVAGHIPGASNHWFKDNFDGVQFKAREDLREAFAPYGDARRIVHQCGSGVSAAANMLAMEHAGLAGSRVYAGSWSEWISDPSHPVTAE
jgi:thiosulfate/3-mercaptopyruvate sulfurtransferase